MKFMECARSRERPGTFVRHDRVKSRPFNTEAGGKRKRDKRCVLWRLILVVGERRETVETSVVGIFKGRLITIPRVVVAISKLIYENRRAHVYIYTRLYVYNL